MVSSVPASIVLAASSCITTTSPRPAPAWSVSSWLRRLVCRMLGMQEWLTSDTRGYSARAEIPEIRNSKQFVKRMPTILQASALVTPGVEPASSVVIRSVEARISSLRLRSWITYYLVTV